MTDLLGVIGAMALETDLIIQRMEDTAAETVCGIRFTRGRLEGRPVVIAQCGIGKVYAALCAALMVQRYAPALLMNIGVAGALTPGLDIADAVVADSAVQHDMDTTALGDPLGMISGPNIIHLPVDPAATAGLVSAAESLGIHCVRAAIATGDRFIDRQEEKRRIAAHFGAAACDMEGGAIAQAALATGTPYAAFRTISDTLTGNGLEYQLNAARATEAGARLLNASLRGASA